MAIPEKIESIATNLPLSQLKKILKALEDKTVQTVPGTYSLCAESGGWQVDFEGVRYSVVELVEVITDIRLISANLTFLQSLINELEAELSVVVNVKDYDKAKEINYKIEQLKSVKQKSLINIG